MEIPRQLGLEREVTEISLPRSETVHFFAGASLTAQEFGRVGAASAARETAVSPTAALAWPQDRLEALLRQRVVDHPLIDVRFGTELLDAQQRSDQIEVRLRAGGGSDSTVRASWLVGADGSRSRVRALPGSARTRSAHPAPTSTSSSRRTSNRWSATGPAWYTRSATTTCRPPS